MTVWLILLQWTLIFITCNIKFEWNTFDFTMMKNILPATFISKLLLDPWALNRLFDDTFFLWISYKKKKKMAMLIKLKKKVCKEQNDEEWKTVI